jgi:serine/threonine protein kinase, bacterial
MLQLLNNRYRLIRTLGSGGFGNTYLAEDSYLPSKKNCVIKQLKPVTTNPQVQQLVQDRFAKEAAILEKLGEKHDQIPKLFAYFIEDDQYYLVQEWVDGETLTNIGIREGILSEAFVTQLLLNILPVLSYIHSNNIVHRDIKPDNIIIRSSDQKPVLIDFGAVKETMGTIVNSQGGTGTSIVIGTPGFMPSEQMTGRPVYSSDLYALGLVAIHLLSGKKPLELETDYQTGEIIWQQYCPQISPKLKNILTKAVMSHARDRFSTAQMMLDAFNSGVENISPTILPTTTQIGLNVAATQISQNNQKSLKPLVILSLIFGIVAILSLILFQNFQPQPDIPVTSSVNTPLPDISPPDPQKALETYYQTLNRGEYETAWNLLSYNFQNTSLHPEGFKSYRENWDQYNSIAILDVELISNTPETAIVEGTVEYNHKNGNSTYTTFNFYLILDQDSNQWLIDKVSLAE